MKLAVSNIAWEPAELDDHLRLLKRLGCQGVEIAPSLIWPEPVKVSTAARREFKQKVDGAGLRIVGLHALLFSRPELEIFGTEESYAETIEYLKHLCALCGDIGGKVLVFGSPKSRRRQGRSTEDCFKLITGFFKEVAPAAGENGVTFCIEPLSPLESDFINTSEEGAALVAAVGHPNFGLHLDAKAMFEQKEDFAKVLAKYGQQVKHFHVGDSNLTPPGANGFDHAVSGRALSQSGYSNYVSIEMRRGAGPSRDVIAKSVKYIKDCYQIN